MIWTRDATEALKGAKYDRKVRAMQFCHRVLQPSFTLKRCTDLSFGLFSLRR